MDDFYANVAVDFVSVAFAILVINALNEKRAQQQLLEQLVRLMGHSTDSSVARQAYEELRARGWLTDGSLSNVQQQQANYQGLNLMEAKFRGVDLRGAIFTETYLCDANFQKSFLWGTEFQRSALQKANFQYAYLGETDFQEANLEEANFRKTYLSFTNFDKAKLRKANFQGAEFLSDLQLANADSLQGSIMPDGKYYDGRFNLKSDLSLARMFVLELEDSEAMARYYGVSLKDYERGQEWAREHLPRFHAELAALRPDEALANVDEEVQDIVRDSTPPPKPISHHLYAIHRIIKTFRNH